MLILEIKVMGLNTYRDVNFSVINELISYLSVFDDYKIGINQFDTLYLFNIQR